MNSSGQSNASLGNQVFSQSSGTTSTNSFITTFSTRDPTTYDFNFPVKQRWWNTALAKEWILVSFSNVTGQTLATWQLISSGGAISVETIQVDVAVPPGVNPVAPNASNIIDFGESFATHVPIATGTNSAGYQTVTRALNELGVELQLAGSNSSVSTPNNFGISQFDSNQFTVTSGYVQVKGSTGPVLQTITGDDTVVVTPDALGNIGLQGLVVANATHAKAVYTESPSVHLEKIDVQLSAAIASTNVANVGLAAFDSKYFTVDANAFVSSKAIANSPGVQNIGISYSAGVFTVLGANGLALSATNPGYVTLNSANIPGQLVTIKITANQSFQDNAGTSTIVGNSFGVSMVVGSAYNSDMPFYLYAVGNSAQLGAGNIETAISFMFSRYPNSQISPVAGKIATSGSAIANSQGSFYAMSGTAANYASSAALSIGSFRMQSTVNVADWTVQTLIAQDGIGEFQEYKRFNIPLGAFGAGPNSFFAANGGTAPIFTANNNYYFLDRFNQCIVLIDNGMCTSAGLGAVILTFKAPFVSTGVNAGPLFTVDSIAAAYTGIVIGAAGFTNDYYLYAPNAAASSIAVQILNNAILLSAFTRLSFMVTIAPSFV